MHVPSSRPVPSALPTQKTPNASKNVANSQLPQPSPKLTPSPVPLKETTPKNDRLSGPSLKSTPSTQSKEATPTKNLASNRLSQLRAQLDFEIQQTRTEDIDKPSAKMVRSSPKPIPAESPLHESKVSTTHSPSSDSIQSVPSPSQFFAANKIISSMKAQLPEEYCNKTKQKDTFADIEQGIYNQAAEYPSLKHPATPPQFSEASKLVSAIKSKLSYKVPYKDTTVKTFTSAKNRMEAFRNSLSSDTERDDSLSSIELPKSEAMDVEDTEEVKYFGCVCSVTTSPLNPSARVVCTARQVLSEFPHLIFYKFHFQNPTVHYSSLIFQYASCFLKPINSSASKFMNSKYKKTLLKRL